MTISSYSETVILKSTALKTLVDVCDNLSLSYQHESTVKPTYPCFPFYISQRPDNSSIKK